MSKLPVPVPPEGKLPALPVSQEGNYVGGDMAGGAINKPVINFIQPAATQTALGQLFKTLMAEAAEDRGLQEYIAELQIFTRTVDDEKVVGIEAKLQMAGRSDQVKMAMQLKEMVFSQLRANIFSPSFQQIYALLLGKIHHVFETWITPAIGQKADRHTVDLLVDEKIVQPILAEIDSCGPGPFLPVQTVKGMVYFLTGNCHIKWH